MPPVHRRALADPAVNWPLNWPRFPLGTRDQDLSQTPLAQRFRVHAARLETHRRSPFSVGLMRRAADSIDAGGTVAALFDGDPCTGGSVPALRLVAVLHYLVLAGSAPELAPFYSAAGAGDARADDAWPAAEAALAANFDEARGRVGRTVQVNEVARSAALYGALLWLTRRHQLPIRLLEIGACAGFNLLADRYRYRVGGRPLGDAASPLELVEPWQGRPVADPWATSEQLVISERGGCDPAPVDVHSEQGRLTLLSFIAPDEPEQLTRLRLALDVAAASDVDVEREPAERWLEQRLAQRRPGTLTVVWQSVIRQYASSAEQAAVHAAIDAVAQRSTAGEALAWLTFEPGIDHIDAFELACQDWPGGEHHLLALCSDLGPPVAWQH